MKQRAISIICATYNGASKLPGLLNCLSENLLHTPDLAEIIFVIDGSTDSSEELIKSFAAKNVPAYIAYKKCNSNVGASEARNIGITIAQAPIIAFVDDDCRPPKEWINQIHSLWDKTPDNIYGIGGIITSHEPTTFNQRYCQAVTPLRPYILEEGSSSFNSRLRSYYSKAPEVHANAQYFAGCNMTFKKSALLQAGGFDPKMKFGGDDAFICKKIRSVCGNNSLVMDPRLVMPHEYSLDFKGSVRRSYFYGRHSGQYCRKTRNSASLNPGPTLGFFTLTLLLGIFKTFFPKFSMSLGILALSLSLLFLYVLLLVSRGVVVGYSVKDKISFSLCFFLCEAVNTYGFILGFIIPNKELNYKRA